MSQQLNGVFLQGHDNENVKGYSISICQKCEGGQITWGVLWQDGEWDVNPDVASVPPFIQNLIIVVRENFEVIHNSTCPYSLY